MTTLIRIDEKPKKRGGDGGEMGRENWHNGGKRDLGVKVAESVTVWFAVSTGHSLPVGKHEVVVEADGAPSNLTFIRAWQEDSQPALITCIIQEELAPLPHIVVVIDPFSKHF